MREKRLGFAVEKSSIVFAVTNPFAFRNNPESRKRLGVANRVRPRYLAQLCWRGPSRTVASAAAQDSRGLKMPRVAALGCKPLRTERLRQHPGGLVRPRPQLRKIRSPGWLCLPFAIPVWNGASARQPVTKARARNSSLRKPPAIANAHTVAANAINNTVSQTTFANFQGKAAIWSQDHQSAQRRRQSESAHRSGPSGCRFPVSRER